MRMLINTIVDDILAQVPIVEGNWDGELKITKEVINEIMKAL